MLISVTVAIAWFFVEAISDILSCAWQDARDARDPLRAGNIGAALNVITYAPVLIVWGTGNWLVIPAAIAGAWVGSYIGVRRLSRREA